MVVVDQVTKAWLAAALGPGESTAVLGDLIRLIHHRNSGALFGLFRDSAPLFAAVSFVVVGLIVAFHGRSPRSTTLSISLGLLLGGAIGNLLDRVRLGHVVDFVDVGLGSLRFWTFNVADAAISIALLLLIVLAIWPSLGRAAPASGPAADAP